MSTKILSGQKLWATITETARNAKKGQRYVAVAYLGTDGTTLLPLGRGDTLVVDCSQQTARASQTNPFEVRKYVEAGVRVYRCEGLHAKVYVFGDTLIIGSPNVSRNSQKYLKEAAVLVTEQRAVDAARRFVTSLARDVIDAKWLAAREQEWVPSRAGQRGASQPEAEMAASHAANSAAPRKSEENVTWGVSKAAATREAARRGRPYELARLSASERKAVRREGALRGYLWALRELSPRERAAIRQEAGRLGYKWAVEGWEHATRRRPSHA